MVSGDHQPRWWSLVSLWIVLVGLSVRLIDIDYGFDGDEVFSAVLAGRSGTDLLVHSLADRTQGPLHIFMLSGWLRIFGQSELALRMLSVLFSVGFLLVLRQLAREQLEAWPGILLLTLGAGGSFFVLNGQQARPYALALMLSVLALLYFLRLMNQGWSQRAIRWWGICSALAVSSSYLLIIQVFILVLLLLGRFPRQKGKIIFCMLTWLAPLGIWLLFAFWGRAALSQGLDLIGWIGQPHPLDFGLFYLDLIGTLPGIPLAWSLALFSLFALPALGRSFKPVEAGVIRPMLLLASVPVVGIYVASNLVPVSLWATRQMTTSALCAVVWLAMGFNGRQPKLTQATLVLIILWLVVSLPNALPRSSKPPWKQVAEDYPIGETHDAILYDPLDGWIASALRWYWPATVLRNPLDVESASSPIAVCHPRRCQALVNAATERGYRVEGVKNYFWISRGLVGDRRKSVDGSPVTWSTAGGLSNAQLRVMAFGIQPYAAPLRSSADIPD